MIVFDASAAVDLLLARAGHMVTRDALLREREAQAPFLLDTEVLSALRRWALRDEMPIARASAAVSDLGALPIRRHPHTPLSPRVWALRHQLSVFDATYVALAEAHEATLISADRALCRAAAGLVEVLEVC